MKTVPLVSLLVASVVGSTAGVALATKSMSSDSRSTDKSPTAKHTASSPTTTGSTSNRGKKLLYADLEYIHDGKSKIAIEGPRNVVGLARADKGYVIAESNNPQNTAHNLWYIDASGKSRNFASIGRSWAVSAAGTEAVAVNTQTAELTAFKLPSGIPVRTFGDDQTKDYDKIVFTGPETVTFTDTSFDPKIPKGRRTWVTWNFKTNDPLRGSTALPVDAVPSTDGKWTVGITGPNGRPFGEVEGGCARAEAIGNNATWTNCDVIVSSENQPYSPNGSSLLTVPSVADGLGPAEFDIVDAATGKLESKFATPQGTLDALWQSDDALLLYGVTSIDDVESGAKWISECTTDGKCKKVVNSDQRLVVARQS